LLRGAIAKRTFTPQCCMYGRARVRGEVGDGELATLRELRREHFSPPILTRPFHKAAR